MSREIVDGWSWNPYYVDKFRFYRNSVKMWEEDLSIEGDIKYQIELSIMDYERNHFPKPPIYKHIIHDTSMWDVYNIEDGEEELVYSKVILPEEDNGVDIHFYPWAKECKDWYHTLDGKMYGWIDTEVYRVRPQRVPIGYYTGEVNNPYSITWSKIVWDDNPNEEDKEKYEWCKKKVRGDFDPEPTETYGTFPFMI